MLKQFFIIFIMASITKVYSGPLKKYYPFNKLHYMKAHPRIKYSPKIAIIDTGIDISTPGVKNSLSFYSSKAGKFVKANSESWGYDYSQGKLKVRPIDNHGHGTHIAGIINEINPHAKLVIIKYFNPMNTDDENLRATISAIKKAVELDVDIINYSSGGEGYSLEEYNALKSARDKGIAVITAAGNFGKNIDIENSEYFPASYKLNNIISVANLDQTKQLHTTSNFGKGNTDIATFGTGVTSWLPKKKLGELSGTSQATAIITGFASLIIGINEEKLHYTDLKNFLFKFVEKSNSLQETIRSKGVFSSTKFINFVNTKNGRSIANK